jgi:hypothetical protein
MFKPPRCPVVRLRFPADGDPAMVTFSAWSAQPDFTAEVPDFTAEVQAWLDAEQERRSRPSGWMIG